MRNDRPRHLTPHFVARGRSLAFNEYLTQQPPERQREILAAERRYLWSVNNPTGRPVADAMAFADSLKGPTYQFPVPQELDTSPALC